MLVTLVSHASTIALRTDAFPADEPIDRPGLEAARAAAGSFAEPHRCLTSPALRARQTATAMGLTATVAEDLKDVDYGRWTGCRLLDVQEEEPDHLMAWTSDPAVAPPGGESVETLFRRVGVWLDNLDDHEPPVIAVTHPAVIRAAIVHALRATPGSFWRIDIHPLSRTVLLRSSGQWRLRMPG